MPIIQTNLRLLMSMVPAMAFAGCLSSSVVKADAVSKVTVPDKTLSLDKRFGITVPSIKDADGDSYEENNLIEVDSKRVLGPINAPTAYDRMNHSELLPAWWSADDQYVLWQVNGKWGMYTQILVCLKDGEIQWELDILAILQRSILARTEAVDPKKFLEAKKANWPSGSAFPEKFTIDSRVNDTNKKPLTFPVRFNVYLTSDVKHMAEIDSYMEATLNKEGEITSTGFHSGKSSSSPWNYIQAAGTK